MGWYASRFPTKLTAWSVARRHGTELLTGEASPYYLFHPLVPHRVAEHLPRVKLIALLRDLVGRAYSHYQHEVARGFETLSFEEAIEAEPARLAGEAERLLAEPLYHSFAHQHHSYLARGRYHEQLERWRARFDDEQLLVLSSERFFAEPERTFRQVLDFLELPAFTPTPSRSTTATTTGGWATRSTGAWSSTTASPTPGCTSRSATTSAGAPSRRGDRRGGRPPAPSGT